MDDASAKQPRKRGIVKVDKLPHRMSGQKWPEREGFQRINCTSGAPGIWSQLSPMKLGPVRVSEHGWKHSEDHGEQVHGVEMPLTASNLENLWQASKAWEGEAEQLKSTGTLDERFSMPSKEFFERRRAIWNDEKAHRWVKKGKDKSGNKNIPLYSLWGSKKLSYIEARKAIYCPIYAQLVKKTVAYKRLEAMLDEGKNILLLEYDGYDRGDKSLEECLNDGSRPFGHGLVLECLLTGQEPWKEETTASLASKAMDKLSNSQITSVLKGMAAVFEANTERRDACCFCHVQPGTELQSAWDGLLLRYEHRGYACKGCVSKGMCYAAL